MIEVIFVVNARGKVARGSGTVETLPKAGEIVTVRGQEYKVLRVRDRFAGTTQWLPKPEIDVEPLR